MESPYLLEEQSCQISSRSELNRRRQRRSPQQKEQEEEEQDE